MARTNLDFSSYKLIVEKSKYATIFELKSTGILKQDINFVYLKNRLVVTGYFGSWEFNHTIMPSAANEPINKAFWLKKSNIKTESDLLYIFDSFEEICKRLKDKENGNS